MFLFVIDSVGIATVPWAEKLVPTSTLGPFDKTRAIWTNISFPKSPITRQELEEDYYRPSGTLSFRMLMVSSDDTISKQKIVLFTTISSETEQLEIETGKQITWTSEVQKLKQVTLEFPVL